LNGAFLGSHQPSPLALSVYLNYSMSTHNFESEKKQVIGSFRPREEIGEIIQPKDMQKRRETTEVQTPI
jgi:hypothetical protein